MKEESIQDMLSRAWYATVRNPALFMPYLWGAIFSLPLVGLVGLEFFSLDLAKLAAFEPASLVRVAIYLFIDFVLLLSLSAFTGAMWLGLNLQASLGKKTNVRSCWIFVRKYFWTLFEACCIVAAMALIPGIICALLLLLLYLTSPIAAIAGGVLLFFIYVLYLLFVRVSFFFLAPIIASKQLSGYGAVRFSMKYLFTRPSHVLLTWAITLIPFIAMQMVSMFVRAGLMVFSIFGIMPLQVFLSFGIAIATVVVHIWLGVYVYVSFFSKNPAPKF